jgi:hypothetical protein
MTRALSSAAHLDFQSAWDYNWRIIIVAPLLLGAWLLRVRRDVRELVARYREGRAQKTAGRPAPDARRS